MLVEGGFLTEDEYAKAAAAAKNNNKPLTEAVVDLGYLSDAEMGSLVATERGLFFINFLKEKVDPNVLALLPEQVARAQRVVVYKKDKDFLWVAMVNPDNYEFIKLLEKRFQTPLKVVLATPAGIDMVIKNYQKDFLLQAKDLIVKMTKEFHEGDIIRLVDLMINAAHEKRASDIHIEPEEDAVIVRFRIDGVMHEFLRYSLDFHEKVVFRIKILARMRTDEHAQAQDGRFEYKVPQGSFNLRVSIIPVTRGENVVMRILSEMFQRLRLEDLGFLEDNLAKVKRAAKMPHGMIIASGPTGSGKTTTLYAIINILNKPDVSLTTIEDPVEYDIRGVRQIQVNPRTNLTFEAGLKSIVRQDPDIIMVGEIRDPQTAGIAINAALTGHLLLSTLHANDAATTFPRLFEMQVEPFLAASSINLVVAQRLVRRICTNCMESYFLDRDTLAAVRADKELVEMIKKISKADDLKKMRVYRGKGCNLCANTGYTGRLGIFELLEVIEEIRPLIVGKATSRQLHDAAVKQGMRTMMEDGLIKVFKGQTTIEEILRVAKS